MKQDSDESQFDKLSFPITYEQARGYEPIGEPNSIARLRKDLGKVLLPNASTSVHSAQDLSMYSKQFHDAYTSAYIDFKERYPQVEVSEIHDDPSAYHNEICIQIYDPSSGNYGKFYLDTEDEFVDSDYILRSFEETAESVGIYPESDESDESLESILSELRDGGFDTSDIQEIRMGLGAYLGYDSEDIQEIVNALIFNGYVTGW